MKQKVIYLLAMLCFAQTMMAQLTSLGLVEESNAKARVTGYSNYIPEISFVGDYLYVGTPKGVYRNLYKSGAEWEKLSLTDELVLDFEVRGDTLIVLTCNQLLCSWDGGETVIQHPIASIIGEGSSDVLQGMGVHPHDATHIFVGTNWSGLWRTRDGGSQWEVIQENGNYEFLDRIYFNPYDNNKLFGVYNWKLTDYVSFHHSTDGGSHWSSVKGDYSEGIAEAYNVAFHPTNENRMVACGLNIYALSDDAGASWNAVRVPNPNRDSQYWPLAAHISDAVYDTRNPEILYGADWRAAGAGATTVCYSIDGGYTWEIFFSDTIASKGHVLSLDMKDNILALYTYGNGIYLLDVDAVEKPKEEPKLFSKDTKWYGSIVEYYWGRPSRYNDLTYHIGADTITDKGFGQNLYRNDEYWGTLITKGEQVWLYPSEALLREGWYFYEFTEPFLLYDFSLQPNDTLFYTWDAVGFSRERPEDEYFQYMVVKNVFHTHGRKVIEFNEGYRWAEGIGCLGGPILNLWRPMTTNGDGIFEKIDRVEANGQVIYSNGEFVNPNIESWLKAGMEWTENKQYTKDGDIVTRKVTISEGDTPGFYKVSSNDSKYKLPFTRLQVTNNKVYGHGLGDVFLLYDFSLKVGDKISLLKYYCQGVYHNIYEYDKCYVTKVDTAVYNGVPRKRITLSGDREDVWVEGIGSLTRVFPIDAVDYDEYSVNAIFSEVVECTYNGETLYQKNFTPPTPKTYLVTEGKQWAVYHNNPLCSKHRSGTTTYRLQGETILYGKTYKKMWVSYKEDLSDMKPFNGYMREENGKVYFANSYEEKLWFDYTAQIGDTLCFKEGSEYGRINNIYEALLSETDSTRSYLCYEMQVGRYNSSKKEVEFVNQYINVYEGLGVIGRDMSYGLCEHYYQSSYDRQCSFTLLCVHDGENILYQTHVGCYKPLDEKPRPTNRKGYGIYYGDSYLYQYTINEAEEVTDSTDFARWHDKTVIYFDVDSVGPKAFTNTCFRQGQTLYFTEKLRYIGQDAFSNIMMLDNEPETKNPFGDLCIVFSGENPPSIGESSIVNYADTTYRITYVVPDLATYIGNDIQWTYSQLVTIDDFIAGYVSPENEVVVSDSAGVDLEVGVVDDGAGSGITVVYATARPKKDIPVRIGDSNGGDIYSRAPAWMRYTVEVVMTDCQGDTLYIEKKQCSAYEEYHFEVTLNSFPEDGIVYVYSRSIDQYGNASDWTMKKIHLMGIDNIAVPESQSPYYDLTGRKVTLPTRGIYIKDGRKVIVHE